MSDQRIQEAIALFEAGRKFSKHGTIKINLNEDGYDIVLVALRNALRQEQQEPKPLGLQTIYFTPYSCEYCGDHLAIGWAFCPECGHQTKNKIAATEPKGDATT